MSLKLAVLKIKLRKLKTLEGYIDYIANQDLSKVPDLSIGDDSSLQTPDYDKLFTYLEEYDQIKAKYALDSIIKGDSDFERALSLMQWLTDNTYYSGHQVLFHKGLFDDTLDILNFSYGKSFEFAINCRYKAIALADLLIAYGIKAMPIAMIDANRDGNHLTVQVFLDDEQKWVLLDPSFNTYFKDENGNILDAFSLRDYFLSGHDPVICGYNFNGTAQCIDIYKELFVKSVMTNLTTWHDNTDANRKSKKFSQRKSFDCKIPRQIK